MATEQIQKTNYVDAFAKLYLQSLEQGDDGATCTISRKDMAKKLFGDRWTEAAEGQRQNLINHVNGLLDLLRKKVGSKKSMLDDDGKPTEDLLRKMPDFKRTRQVEMITDTQVDAIIDQLFDDF